MLRHASAVITAADMIGVGYLLVPAPAVRGNVRGVLVSGPAVTWYALWSLLFPNFYQEMPAGIRRHRHTVLPYTEDSWCRLANVEKSHVRFHEPFDVDSLVTHRASWESAAQYPFSAVYVTEGAFLLPVFSDNLAQCDRFLPKQYYGRIASERDTDAMRELFQASCFYTHTCSMGVLHELITEKFGASLFADFKTRLSWIL